MGLMNDTAVNAGAQSPDMPRPDAREVADPHAGGLRAFQASLIARMQAASSEDPRSHRLGVTIGGLPCLLPLADAGEIVPLSVLPPFTRVPLTQPWYLGLANIRGNLVGVVDLAWMAGLPPQGLAPASRVLVLAPALAPNCGILLGSVQGMRDLADMEGISKNFDEAFRFPGENARYRDNEGTEWREIGLASLLQEAAFLHIGR